MRGRDSGLIVNITSLASRLPVPFMAAYNAAKAAMASFTMTLQIELESSNIRIIDLQPGDICTNFNDVVQRTSLAGSSYQQPAVRAWKVADQNLKAGTKPDVVARRISALLEQENPPPRVTVADPFQAIVAPTIFGLLPQRVRVHVLRKYYKI